MEKITAIISKDDYQELKRIKKEKKSKSYNELFVTHGFCLYFFSAIILWEQSARSLLDMLLGFSYHTTDYFRYDLDERLYLDEMRIIILPKFLSVLRRFITSLLYPIHIRKPASAKILQIRVPSKKNNILAKSKTFGLNYYGDVISFFIFYCDSAICNINILEPLQNFHEVKKNLLNLLLHYAPPCPDINFYDKLDDELWQLFSLINNLCDLLNFDIDWTEE